MRPPASVDGDRRAGSRRRVRRRGLAAGACAALALAAVPARAQEAPADEPTTVPSSPTTATPTTLPPLTLPPLTLPPVTLPPDLSVPLPPLDPGATTTTADPTATSSTSTTAPADDPAAGGDAPPETVPPAIYTIPPRPAAPGGSVGRGSYAGQGAFANHPGRVVRVSATSARVRAATTQAALDAALGARNLLQVRAEQLRADVRRLLAAERAAIEALEDAQVELRERAAQAYIRGTSSQAALLFTSSDAAEYGSRVELLEVLVERDLATVDAFEAARAAVDEEQAATARELAVVRSQLLAAEDAVAAAEAEAAFATRELAVTLAGGTVVIHGFTFPVLGPFNYIDSFGFPRMTGTEHQHWHEGTDIFAPYGNELLAAERGVVARMRTGTLGGITLWLHGESGTAYYYAHLSGYAPGVHEGLVVEAGTVLGYVGDTGNARGTPPHLHFEIHPDRGDAVNPYPILIVAQEQPQPEPIRLGGL